MRIVFFGTPDFAVPSLAALLEAGEEVVAVVTQPDRPKGRGRLMSEPPVKEFAVARAIPVLQPPGIKTPSFLDELSDLGADCIAVVAYGKILPRPVLGLPPFGCVNVHASLLPKYRGAAPVQWAIIRGEETTGVTTMLMDEGLDTGDILLQERTDISEEDDSSTLSRRLSGMGASLLVRTLKELREGSVCPQRQTGTPSYAPPLGKEDGRIDWSMEARSIFNLIRGTFPWPGAYCQLNGERITILKARVSEDRGDWLPGRILRIGPETVGVAATKGFLDVSEVKPEGKRAMTAAAFMRGRRVKEGAFFDRA